MCGIDPFSWAEYLEEQGKKQSVVVPFRPKSPPVQDRHKPVVPVHPSEHLNDPEVSHGRRNLLLK